MSNITLKSNDGKSFEIEKELACESELIKSMTEDLGQETIPLDQVDSETLDIVVKWLNLMKQQPPQSSEELNVELEEWEKPLLEVTDSSKDELIKKITSVSFYLLFFYLIFFLFYSERVFKILKI